MTIRNFTFFSPTGTEFPVSSNADAKLYLMLSGMELDTYKRKDWKEPVDTALNRQYSNTSLVVGGRYFELEGETVALQPSADNYIHANIDLTKPTAPVTLSVEVADNTNSTDINNGSGVLKHCFDIVKTDTMGVIGQRVPIKTTVLDKLTVNELVVSTDIPWTTLGAGSRYKKTGDEITISFNYTPGGNGNFNMGTLPANSRPFTSTMFHVPAFSSSLANDKHVQINESGVVTLLGAVGRQRYSFQFKFDIK
ncbi:receptor binding protein [Lactococcus phage PLgY-30]|uniref:Receptor binding protein n=1 Tax=Lactococcus phage PLgY-30 TaxID=1983590 RepID=A0A2Z2P6N9_9CAUD|nr:receptor binding protein [Lactococcus phage PLgY-30]